LSYSKAGHFYVDEIGLIPLPEHNREAQFDRFCPSCYKQHKDGTLEGFVSEESKAGG
jgi:hypothetical protein